MTSLSQAVQQAAGTLQQISDTTTGARGRRAGAVALVLRCVEGALHDGRAGGGFLLRRAELEVAEVESAAERALLRRLLIQGRGLEETGAVARLAELLVEYAYELELTRRLPEADAVLTLARSAAPDSASVALHAGRVARKQADRDRALSLYRTARELDRSAGALARLARIGEAVVSAEPERELGVVIRHAVRVGDAEAAAVALEERARLRRERGARRAAARDLCIAAVRFVDPVDRARVAHQIADLFAGGDDPLAVRQALLLALSVGDASQRDHARARLHTVSRDLDDQVGMRRWRSFQRPALVSLSARARTPVARSAAPVLARWREQVEQLTDS